MRALTSGQPVARRDESAGHPMWCAGGHHCTFGRMPAGQHASIPEVWVTDLARLVATRYRDERGRDRVELRVVLKLDNDERSAEDQARLLLAGTYAGLRHVLVDGGGAEGLR